MEFKVIKYNSPEYAKMVNLRYKILREPLGLVFTEEDLEKDRNDILLVAMFPNSYQVIACCILTPLNEFTVKLRQMAVGDFYQGRGLGADMLDFAETVASKNNFSHVYLHARKIAVGFYKKQGYAIEGDGFEEVSIPHFEMLKSIK